MRCCWKEGWRVVQRDASTYRSAWFVFDYYVCLSCTDFAFCTCDVRLHLSTLAALVLHIYSVLLPLPTTAILMTLTPNGWSSVSFYKYVAHLAKQHAGEKWPEINNEYTVFKPTPRPFRPLLFLSSFHCKICLSTQADYCPWGHALCLIAGNYRRA